ncbi:ABC-type nitrate/sulfonate/bicarbonate transport system substrate-binding protein [Haloactinopolyspora alba]|uniref:ABC-type nitrate/sulfonate/bicarbonate transport system substrate-binding protein n=1 Tax=Haloactinopolyspora alba TaxID=648780 RepID=A0A2P8E046_9ACTN|nr:ABC transporter substrate-binding protein [Haloactinopolyspora alba]PSL02842.1 ABC-type nitrate/sulfonate/bicarbonate transport system substrate-binding protein [Haloactinopolyspora alba]
MPGTTQHRRARVLAAVSALALALSACGSDDGSSTDADAGGDGGSGLTEITAASQPNGAGLAMYIANELGYFEEEGLSVDVENYASGPASLTAGAAGQWQAGWLGAPPALTGGNQFGLIMAGLMITEDANHVMYMSKDVLQGSSPAEVLRDNRVATGQNTLAEQVMRGCAEHLGVDPAAVQIVPLDGGQIVQALTSGQVNVVNTWSSPGYGLIENPDYEAVCDGEQAGVSVVDPYVVTPEFAEQNPEGAAAFLRAVYRANEFINQNHEKAVDHMEDYFLSIGVDASRAQADYETSVRNWLTLDEAIKSIESGETAGALKASAEFFVEAGVYPQAPPIDDLLAQGKELLVKARDGAGS